MKRLEREKIYEKKRKSVSSSAASVASTEDESQDLSITSPSECARRPTSLSSSPFEEDDDAPRKFTRLYNNFEGSQTTFEFGCGNDCGGGGGGNTNPVCGNGIVKAGEECDDGNRDNQDSCSNACKNALCGDGICQNLEQCDDGNSNNNDSCTNECENASCGDGFVPPGEDCDDSNNINQDSCTNACKNPRGGDGIVQTGEECDDGNNSNTDSCTNSCKNSSCGDGFIQSGEQCDDGNTRDGDGCSSSLLKSPPPPPPPTPPPPSISNRETKKKYLSLAPGRDSTREERVHGVIGGTAKDESQEYRTTSPREFTRLRSKRNRETKKNGLSLAPGREITREERAHGVIGGTAEDEIQELRTTAPSEYERRPGSFPSTHFEEDDDDDAEWHGAIRVHGPDAQFITRLSSIRNRETKKKDPPRLAPGRDSTREERAHGVIRGTDEDESQELRTTAQSSCATSFPSSYFEEDDDDAEWPGAIREHELDAHSHTSRSIESREPRYFSSHDLVMAQLNQSRVQSEPRYVSSHNLVMAQMRAQSDRALEAELVEDGGGVTQTDLERIVSQVRESVYEELGEVTEARIAVIEEVKQTSYRGAIVCSFLSFIIFVGAIIGAVFVVRSAITEARSSEPTPQQDMSAPPSPTSKESFDPLSLDNNRCDEAHPIFLHDTPAEGSLGNAAVQAVVFCPNIQGGAASSTPVTAQYPGLWYRYRGTGNPVKAVASGDVSLWVYSYPSDADCDVVSHRCLQDAIYQGNSAVSWPAIRDTDYMLLVSHSDGLEGNNFTLTILDNHSCENAFGRFTPRIGLTLLGSTSDGAGIDTSVEACGLASGSTAPGTWYIVTGNGMTVTASTCFGTGFDSQISIFTGNCNNLECVDGNNNACGLQSYVAWHSIPGEAYFILVHGSGTSLGSFALQISTEGSAFVDGDFCDTATSLGLGEITLPSLDGATPEPSSIERCFSNRDHGRDSVGIWYKILGTGGTMSAIVESDRFEVDFDFDSGIFVSILSGPSCSELSCVSQDCSYSRNRCGWESLLGEEYYVYIGYIPDEGRPEDMFSLIISTTAS